jgi:hypothetical protein
VTWEGLNPPYATIVVDPPWHYSKVNPDKDAESYRGGGLAYSSMGVAEIMAMPVADLATPDSRCFLWVTNRYLELGWSVLRAPRDFSCGAHLRRERAGACTRSRSRRDRDPLGIHAAVHRLRIYLLTTTPVHN